MRERTTTRTPVQILPLLALLLLAPDASASEDQGFLRLVQTSKLSFGKVASSYSVEMKKGIKEYEKSDGGGGGGGGLGGKKDYEGVNHRLHLHVGFSDWASVGLEQTLKHPEIGDIQVGVIYPELVLNLSKAESIPFRLTFFTGPRIRISARRGTSMVMGFGIDKMAGRFDLGLKLGYERSAEPDEPVENGMRYNLGVAAELASWASVAVEAWGALVWPEESVFQQDHHGGPSVMFRYKRAWLAINGNIGMKERPNKFFLDYGVMFQLGIRT